jgi:predicted metal-dependent peptidase
MNKKKERVKHGGTDFNAPTKYVNEQSFDGHIVLTDMQAEKPVSSKCQRMWMTTRDCLNGMPFKTHERVIAVD